MKLLAKYDYDVYYVNQWKTKYDSGNFSFYFNYYILLHNTSYIFNIFKNLKIMIKLKNPVLLQFEELMSSPDYQTNDVAYTLMYKEVDLKNWDLEDKLTLHFFLSNTEVKANNGGTEENRNEFRAKMIDEIDTLLEKVPHEEQLDMMGHLFKNYFFKFFYEEVEEVDENSKV